MSFYTPRITRSRSTILSLHHLKPPVLKNVMDETLNRTFDNIDKGSREDLYSEKRYPIISRFNLDSKTNYIYLNDPKASEENVVDIIDGCSLYSKVPGIEPFSLGESNLVQAALDEGLLSQAIQLTSFFSSSFKIYPEPEKAFDLLVKCIELVDKYISSKKKHQSLSSESEQALSNTNTTPNLAKSQGHSHNDLSTEGLDKVIMLWLDF
ncbi:hypothetical protein DSO57_1004306 [Entomophthora muscae]|uniref:Uncharacterized protein n=1 Tax=Entomophthora muscae TaxID=34485 RepID=A0ACC2TW24_9FUNG|nr:hypothetical protein DSO57_1004306 [Entomophthora muscae]